MSKTLIITIGLLLIWFFIVRNKKLSSLPQKQVFEETETTANDPTLATSNKVYGNRGYTN